MSGELTAPWERWDVGSNVYSVAVSRDGSHVASGSGDNYVRVWDVRTGALAVEPLKGHTSRAQSVAFSPDSTQVVSGSYDKTIRFWDVRTGTPIGEPLEGHTDYVRSVEFSHDGNCIVSGSADATARIWDARTGTLIGEPLRGHTAGVWSVAFSHDSTRVVSGSDDGTIRIWDVYTGTSIGEPLKGHAHSVWSVAFSHDSMRVVSGSADQTIRIWDAHTRAPVGEPLRGHTGSVISVAFSHDSTHIVSGSYDATVRMWDARTGTPVGEPLQGEPLQRYADIVWSVAFSADNTHIYSGSEGRYIYVWEVPQNLPSSDTATSKVINSSPTPVHDEISSPTIAETQPSAARIGKDMVLDAVPQNTPLFDTVSSSMSIQEMFECLVKHGCTDLTSLMDADRRSSEVIASGGFGDVRRVALDDGTFLALKTLRLHILRTGGDKGVKRAVREVYLWSRLHHPHIQELLGIIVFQGGLGMISPWRAHGNLQAYIAAHPDVARYPLCIQLASAVSHLHFIGMVHGDLKSFNVLVADDDTLKISDFDYAIASNSTLQFSTTTRPGGGTLRWMAPELSQAEEDEDEDGGENRIVAVRSKQTDVYALGMTMLEIMSGTVPYAEYRTDMGIYRAISAKMPPRRPKELSGTSGQGNQMWELLLRCWDHDPLARPDASSVLALLQSFAS